MAASAYIEITLIIFIAPFVSQQYRCPTEITESLIIINIIINLQSMPESASSLTTGNRPTLRTIELILFHRLTHSADSVADPLLVTNHTRLFLGKLVKLLSIKELFKFILIEVGQFVTFNTFVPCFVLQLSSVLLSHVLTLHDMSSKLVYSLQWLAKLPIVRTRELYLVFLN